jgi:hypothetical protein
VRISFVLILLTTSFAGAQGQPGSFAIEGGLNSSGIPHYEAAGKVAPHLSPLMGIHFSFVSPSRFYADAGIRYCIVGRKTSNHRELYDQGVVVGTSDSKELMRFQKISFGLGGGYQFQVWKKTFSAGMGYRLLYLPSGRYSAEVFTTDGSVSWLEYINNYDPMNTPELVKQAKKIGHELFVTLGLSLTQKVRIELQYSFPTAVRFVEHGSVQDLSHSYSQNDISLTGFFRLGE